MLFNSYDYLLAFLPLALAIYFGCAYLRLPPMSSMLFLALASLGFYAYWRVDHLAVILASAAFNFGVGRMLSAGRNSETGEHSPKGNRWLLAFGIFTNLALLGYFKYAVFAVDTVSAATGQSFSIASVALPLGISFFTFTQIAFLVDSYGGKTSEPSLTNYVLFVTFFPHLLAGPILHHRAMMSQFADPKNARPFMPHIAQGLLLIAIGLAKKVLIADPLAPVVEAGYAGAGTLNALEAWNATLAYTFQLYFDFSGYTDMALGSALLFNIRMPVNFNSPYHATDIQDFWRRWHITLSQFLRTYLYVPLGGNRHGEARTWLALFAVFALGGLWHGAGWTFIAWGVMHGLGMIGLRVWRRFGVALPKPFAWALTFLFVHVVWIFFRAPSMDSAVQMLNALMAFDKVNWAAIGAMFGSWKTMQAALWPVFVLSMCFVLIALPRNSNRLSVKFDGVATSWPYAAALMAAGVLSLGQVTHFLYFNF
jgi:alginate O-acetyltransferase complex protein AlgI